MSFLIVCLILFSIMNIVFVELKSHYDPTHTRLEGVPWFFNPRCSYTKKKALAALSEVSDLYESVLKQYP